MIERFSPEMVYDKHGDFVEYSDYEILEAIKNSLEEDILQLKDEISNLKKEIKLLKKGE